MVKEKGKENKIFTLKKKKVYKSPFLQKQKFSYLTMGACYQCATGPIALSGCYLFYTS